MLSLRLNLRNFIKNSRHFTTVPKFAVENQKSVEEVKIPVPWGHVSGKWWGPKHQRPIFLVHGWQDNSGTFDRLIPYLPQNLGYLALDFPGHGYSSNLPNGMLYHAIDASIFIQRLKNYFGWEKISLLGHSLGAVTSFIYTALFPDNVDMLVCMDAYKPLSFEPGKSIKATVKSIDSFLRYDELNIGGTKPPTYTYAECLEKQHIGSRKSINRENCCYIVDRSIEKCPNSTDKYYFTRDSRLKVGTVVGMQHNDILAYAKRIKCPHMVLKSPTSPYFEDKTNFYAVLDILKHNRLFQFHYVEGTHHFHLNTPENAAPMLVDFLNMYTNTDTPLGGPKN